MTASRRRRWLAALVAVSLAAAAMLTAVPASATAFTYNNTTVSAAYSTGWTHSTAQVGYSFGDAHFTNEPGRTVTFSFIGTAVSWIGAKNPLHGRADVKVCDGSGANCSGTTLVDSYASTTQPQQILFTASGLGAGAHRLIITTRSDSSGSGTYTDIDYFIADNGESAISGTRYVDNRAGSNCSNAGQGTSTAAPWCDFTPVTNRAFAPGAQLLLARGATFTGPLQITGSGTSGSWITLGAYGSGSKPIIQGNSESSDRAVVVQNPDFWHIQDLELRNAGMGLMVPFTTHGHQGLDIRRLWVHDMSGIFNARGEIVDYPDTQNSTAITITAAGAPVTSPGQSVLTDVSIRDNWTEKTSAVYLMADPGFSGTSPYAASTFKNVDITSNRFKEADAPMIAVEAAQNVLFESNWVDCRGHEYEPQGTTCFFLSKVENAAIQNNVVYNMPNNGAHDQTGIDPEYAVNATQIRGNLFANNAGAGVELLQLGGRAGDYSTNTVIEQNAFYNNGASGQKGHIAVFTSPGVTPPQALIQSNVYQTSPSGFISDVNQSPNLTNVTQVNNSSVASIYPAAWHFSGVQGQFGWRQQSYGGTGSWTDLPSYSSSLSQWAGSGGSKVDAFTLTTGTGASQWVARAWTAPAAGTVQIHGRVFMNDTSSSGASVLIEKNGTSIWPAGGGYQTITADNRSGYNSAVRLTVSAGDVIRFVAYAGAANATVGWTPSISYE